MLPRWRRIIIRAINTLVPVSIGEEVNSQNTMGAHAAATIELRETTRVARMTRTKIGNQSEDPVTFADHSSDIGRSDIATPGLAHIDTRQRTQNVTRRHRAEQIGEDNRQKSCHSIDGSFAGY